MDKATTNATNISIITSDISLLDGRVGTNTSDISTLNSDLSLLDGRVVSNTTDISTLNSDLSLLDGRVVINAANIGTNTSDISTLNSDLSLLDGRVVSNTTDITTLNSDLSLLDDRVGTNTSDITSLNELTDIQAFNIAGLISSTDSNTTSINTLDNVYKTSGDEGVLDNVLTINNGNDVALNILSQVADGSTNSPTSLSLFNKDKRFGFGIEANTVRYNSVDKHTFYSKPLNDNGGGVKQLTVSNTGLDVIADVGANDYYVKAKSSFISTLYDRVSSLEVIDSSSDTVLYSATVSNAGGSGIVSFGTPFQFRSVNNNGVTTLKGYMYVDCGTSLATHKILFNTATPVNSTLHSGFIPGLVQFKELNQFGFFKQIAPINYKFYYANVFQIFLEFETLGTIYIDFELTYQ